MKTGVNGFVLKRRGRHGPTYDAIYLPGCLYVWDFVTRLSADWTGLAGLLLFGLPDTILFLWIAIFSGLICISPYGKIRIYIQWLVML